MAPQHKKHHFFPPHIQAVRPLVSFFLAMAACLAWALYSPNDVFRSDVRCFFYMSGTLYANMSCRLIVAQGGSQASKSIQVTLKKARISSEDYHST